MVHFYTNEYNQREQQRFPLIDLFGFAASNKGRRRRIERILLCIPGYCCCRRERGRERERHPPLVVTSMSNGGVAPEMRTDREMVV